MVLQLFEVLFVLSLAGLVLAVPLGVLLLAWPRSGTVAPHSVPHGVGARA